MQHPEIERDCLIDRYVRNTLRGAERQAFEEHFLDCPQCLDQLETASSLREAIRESAVEAVTASPAARPLRWFAWKWVQAGAAACLAVTTVTSVVSFQQARQARSRLASAQSTFERELGNVKGLASSPEVYMLGQSRGSGEMREIALPPAPRWMVFSVEMDTTRFTSYRSTLGDSSGKQVWQQDDIRPVSPDELAVTVPSNRLVPGLYALTIATPDQAAIIRFPIRFK